MAMLWKINIKNTIVKEIKVPSPKPTPIIYKK